MPADWLRISSLAEGRLARDVAAFGPTHIVSLVNPDFDLDRRPPFPDDVDVHTVARRDVVGNEIDGPDEDAVAALIAWLQPIIAARRSGTSVRLLSHCHQGISRSTGAALVALTLDRDGDAKAAFADLLSITNKPWPNAKILALAETAQNWDGRLSVIVEDYKRAFRHRPASYARLQRRMGLYL